MMALDDRTIGDWHAHVYFNEQTLEQASALCERAAIDLPVEKGRVHQQPVGPHPKWSCQLAFDDAHLGVVVHWLTLNRDGLTIFMHPNSGNELVDHRDRAIWLGTSDSLNLAMFE